MRTFAICQNNTFTAVLTGGDYDRLLADKPLENGFFLFSYPDLPEVEPWCHGTTDHWSALVRDLGSTVEVRSASFGVPFSNGAQLYASAGPDVLEAELGKLATWPAVMRVFGPDAWRVYHQVDRERRLALAR